MADGRCYRALTRGPCTRGLVLSADGRRCARPPCRSPRLYVGGGCHRPGQRGPCPAYHVVTFDLEARPALDGRSHKGMCVRARMDKDTPLRHARRQPAEEQTTRPVISHRQMVEEQATPLRDSRLYTAEGCPPGQWLVPNHATPGNTTCDCRPGYSRSTEGGLTLHCLPPIVNLAKYLNKHFNIHHNS